MSHYILKTLILVSLPISATANDNVSHVADDGAVTCITSNGALNHDMGGSQTVRTPTRFALKT